MIQAERRVNGTTTTETRYYISSLAGNAAQIANAVRSHWSIENSLHWVLDVSFSEDASRIRTENAPQNFALLRQIALNLLTQEQTAKVGVKAKRKKAGWGDAYLCKVLAQ
jgi:predicted transposase YbfD/YdcC